MIRNLLNHEFFIPLLVAILAVLVSAAPFFVVVWLAEVRY